ncbi:DUF2513 domain-containing protein [Anaerophilus nitritogenes]|uniref:DUF2513 domain-containing protein n=1 Tax=Anaerophilus nitritogenes TaxID=2498136 RepID=UPI0013EB26C0|nr:DUF2513 domain-containing protein [Anaerophilus nitritogenes]
MILNYDCLRDVLLSLEKNLLINENLSFNHIDLNQILAFDSLKDYKKEDIYYCIFNLIEINFIDGRITFADGGIPYICLISNITYSGHEFLQSIKSDTIWENIKTKLKPVTALSIPLITDVAKELIISSIGI